MQTPEPLVPASLWRLAARQCLRDFRADALGLRVGDPLLLGDATLRVARVIVLEPDRGAGFASFAPRVMLNQADLAATGLVQPASRVTYRLAVASKSGNDDIVARYTDWA